MRPSRHRLALAAVAVLALAAVAVIAAGREKPEPGGAVATPAAEHDPGAPNIVVVLTDDQDVSSLRVMPATRRLVADRGVSFANAYVTTPECCPSRASFLTGQYAHNHGVLASSPPDGGYIALDGTETLPVWLLRAGYETAYFGKYLNNYGNSRQGADPAEVPPGWSQWLAPVNGTEHEMYGYELNDNGHVRAYGDEPRQYLTDVLRRRAVSFLRSAAGAGRPFFLTIAPLAPHGEGSVEDDPDADRDPRPAPRHRGRFEHLPRVRLRPAPGELGEKPAIVRSRARNLAASRSPAQLAAIRRGRLESLLAVDELVAAVIGELRRAGELRRTYVIFTSDNGFLLGEHGLVGKDLPYEGSARVPLLVRGPGVPPGEVSEALVANIDLAPAITRLARAEPGLEFDGVSLLRAARRPADRAATGPRRALLIELPRGRKRYRAVRTGRWLFARYENGDVELYDLRRDPRQLDNLAADPAHREVRRRLASELRRLAECAGAQCR